VAIAEQLALRVEALGGETDVQVGHRDLGRE
jgi:hypothetical protein